MAFKPILISTLTAAALLGCATSTSNPDEPKGIAAFADDPRLGDKADRICFNQTIDGFSDNRDRTVVLERGVNEHYIVETLGICPQLDRAQTIGIDSALSCVSKGDYLIVSDSAFSLKDSSGIGPDRCVIDEIYKWNEDALDEG